jgi:hypothetical protein
MPSAADVEDQRQQVSTEPAGPSFVPDEPPAFAPHPDASNPVLTPADVTDLPNATTLFDPFVVFVDGQYHMFFEIVHEADSDRSDADVGHATSPDGLSWTYDQVVLREPGDHLAYPNVFRWAGEWYMTPDRHHYGARFDVYRAVDFPTEWTLERTPRQGVQYTDPTLVRIDDRWYSWFYRRDPDGGSGGTVLYHSGDLLEGWTEHPASPVTASIDRQRPAGRPIVTEEAIYLFVMDNTTTYGDAVRCFRVTDLTPTDYRHEEVEPSPLLGKTEDGTWHDNGMHHVDAGLAHAGHGNLVAVDGQEPPGDGGQWSIGIYTIDDAE